MLGFERIFNDFKDRQARLNKALIEDIDQIIKQQTLSHQISTIEILKDIQTHSYQKAASYTNLIILAGYAGIFAVWQHVKDILNPKVTIWVALLVSLSILIFIGYEVWRMIGEALFIQSISPIIESNLPEKDRLAAWERAFKAYARKHMKLWPFFLIPTVISGFAAGFVLISAFIGLLFA